MEILIKEKFQDLNVMEKVNILGKMVLSLKENG